MSLKIFSLYTVALPEAKKNLKMTMIEKYMVQDLHLVDLEDFRYGGTNITAFRLVDPNNPLVQEVVR